MNEVLEVVKSVDFDGDEELAEALRAEGVGSDSLPAAKAVAKILSGYSDTIGKSELATIAKSAGFEISETQDDDEETDVDDIEKSDLEGLDESTQQAVLKALDKNEELEKAVDMLKNRLDDRREQEILEKNVEKARELDGIDADAEELGETLKTIEQELGEDYRDNVVSKLEDASEAVKTSAAFEETGSSNRDSATSDAYDEMMKRVEKRMDEHGESRGEAMTAVEKSHPELAERYLEDVRS